MRCKKLLLGCAGLLASVAFLCIGCGDKGDGIVNSEEDNGPYELVLVGSQGCDIEKKPNERFFNHGDEAAIDVAWAPPYRFEDFTGPWDNTWRWSSPYRSEYHVNLTMKKNTLVYVRCNHEPSLSAIAVPENGGTVAVTKPYMFNTVSSRESERITVVYDSIYTAKAIANPGFIFVRWSGASTSVDDSVSVVITEDSKTITANFQAVGP
jgi:hypothetical protein